MSTALQPGAPPGMCSSDLSQVLTGNLRRATTFPTSHTRREVPGC